MKVKAHTRCNANRWIRFYT